MTRSTLTIVAAVVLLCGFNKAWKLYTYKPAGLSVMMPETPKETSSKQQTAAGEITLWQATVVGTTRAYYVSYSDMPRSTWNGDPKKMLEGARDGAAQRVKGTISADKEIKLGKNPGREFRIVLPTLELTQRVYLVKHRLYQVSMGCATGTCGDDEVQEFLSSFKLK